MMSKLNGLLYLGSRRPLVLIIRSSKAQSKEGLEVMDRQLLTIYDIEAQKLVHWSF